MIINRDHIHFFACLLLICSPALSSQEIDTSLEEKYTSGVLVSDVNQKKWSYSNLNKVMTFSTDQSAIVKVDYTQKDPKNTRLKKIIKEKSQGEGFNFIVQDIAPGEKISLREMNITWDKGDGEYFSLSGEYHAKLAKISLQIPDIKIYDNLLYAYRTLPVNDFLAYKLPDLNHSYFYKNAYAVGNEPTYCDIRSPWMMASRNVQYLEDGVLIKDSVTLLKRNFTASELTDESFIATSNQFQRCFKDNILHLSLESKKHLVVTKEFEDSITTLPIEEKVFKRIEKVKEISASCDKSNGMHEEMMRILLERNLADDPASLRSYQFLIYYFQKIASAGDGKYSKHNYDEAMKYIDKALSYNPDFIEALVSKAWTLCMLRRCEEGQKILNEKVLTKKMDNFSYYAFRGIRNFYDIIGDKKNRLKYENLAFQKVDTKFERSEIFKIMGSTAFLEGDMDGCVKYYNRAIEADEDSSCSHSSLGQCYFIQKNYPMAVFAYENALSKNEHWYFRVSLGKIFYIQAKEFEEKKNFKTANELYIKTFDIVTDWKAAIELLKFYLQVNEPKLAYKAALKAANLFEDDPKILAGYIALAFKIKDKAYSNFMEKIIADMKDRFNANELAYYVGYSLQHEADLVQRWLNLSIKDLSQMKFKPEDNDKKIKTNILMSKFYLLNLSLTRKASDLERANAYFEIARNVRPRDKEVLQHEYYVETANRALGKGRIFWESRLSLERKFGITLPLWMLQLLYL